MKKLLEGEGLWEVRKEILGWIFDGATRCIELAEKKRDAILAELKTCLRIKSGVGFNRIQKLVGKLRHASIGIPAGKYLFGPINQLMTMELKQIYLLEPMPGCQKASLPAAQPGWPLGSLAACVAAICPGNRPVA